MSARPVCPDCARRSWLVARLAGHLERHRAERRAIREVLALSDERLIAALGGALRGEITREWRAVPATALARRWTSAEDRDAVCRHDAAYPTALHDLPDPPAVLHLHGDRPAAALARLLGAGARAVAIVGARRASADGREVARLLGRGLSAAGVTVVSGMALGIDAAAHEGALEAGGATVAVLACGPERPYPPSRRRLHERLADGALVVSELPPGTPPYRWAFPARNRIIAALSAMTVVVEAAERSGSLITAEIAADLGRDVGAAPGSPQSWHSAGANALLRDGARVVRGPRDVLDDVLGTDAVHPAGAPDALAGLEPRLRDLLAAIDRGADTVGHHAADPAGARLVLADLTELELLGLVERRPGGRYARSLA
jgi:DNA processing protein